MFGEPVLWRNSCTYVVDTRRIEVRWRQIRELRRTWTTVGRLLLEEDADPAVIDLVKRSASLGHRISREFSSRHLTSYHLRADHDKSTTNRWVQYETSTLR